MWQGQRVSSGAPNPRGNQLPTCKKFDVEHGVTTTAELFGVLCSAWCTPGMGRELMGFKSPVSVPCNVVKRNKITSQRQVSADSEGVTVRWGLKEPERSGDHEPQAKATAGSGNSADPIVAVNEVRDFERRG